MFEEKTRDAILADVLAEGKALGIDTRQGSIFYDAVSPTCSKIAQFYADLNNALLLVFLPTAVDEYLDMLGEMVRVYRNSATAARYGFLYEGTRPAAGERFFTAGRYFVLVEDSALYLEAEDTGIVGNDVIEGTAAVPVNNISGLISSQFGALIDPGTDLESDDNYRQRIQEKLSGAAQNGNRQHYKSWAEEVAGVGRARIIPLFAGENTVMAVLYGTDGLPAVDAVVGRVQEYIDPITLGLTREYEGVEIPVGDGTGRGVANIGAHLAVIPAQSLDVSISFTAAFSREYTAEDIQDAAAAAIRDHFKNLALETPEEEDMVLRYAEIGSVIYALPAVADYTNLTINGATENITLKDTQAAVLQEVIVNAAV